MGGGRSWAIAGCNCVRAAKVTYPEWQVETSRVGSFLRKKRVGFLGCVDSPPCACAVRFYPSNCTHPRWRFVFSVITFVPRYLHGGNGVVVFRPTTRSSPPGWVWWFDAAISRYKEKICLFVYVFYAHVQPKYQNGDVRPEGVADWITARGGGTERTLTAMAGPSPRDPYRHSLAMRPSQKARPFRFLNYY